MDPINTTVHWGVMGTARIAEKVGAAIQQAHGCELFGIASRSAQRAADWATQHSVIRSYGSYQALLDDPQVDAVYIPLPPSMHAEWTIRAAEHGKHVLCEKPLAIDIKEAEEMSAACRQHNVQLMDGVMWVHHPRAIDMQQTIQNGTLGKLRRVTSAFSFNWNEVPENDFRLSREMGGGSLVDLGWYCIRATLWAFCGLPQRVFGTARNYRNVDMNFSGLMWYDDERMATFDSGFDTELRKWLEVAGSQASLVCDGFTKPWDEQKPRFWLHNSSGKVSEHVSAAPVQEVCMIEDFSQIVRSGTLDDRWPKAAVATQRVCDALDRSARIGQVVEL